MQRVSQNEDPANSGENPLNDDEIFSRSDKIKKQRKKQGNRLGSRYKKKRSKDNMKRVHKGEFGMGTLSQNDSTLNNVIGGDRI